MQYLVMPNHGHGEGHGEAAGEGAAAGTQAAEHAHDGMFSGFGHDLSVYFHNLHLYDLLVYAGLLGVVAGVTLLNVRRNNLVPLRDPRLPETLHFHNI